MTTIKTGIRGLAPLEIEAIEFFSWIKKLPSEFKLLMRFGKSKRYYKYYYSFRNGVYYLTHEKRPILNLKFQRLQVELNRDNNDSQVPFAGYL